AKLRDAIREEATQDTVRLAILVAERILQREVATDSDALAGLVKDAVGKLKSRELKKVRVHPRLEPLVQKCFDASGTPADLVLVADPALKPGDVFFETSQGVLDASIETQLREIERGLTDSLR